MEIKDIGFAVKLYYSKIELNNDDIGQLFGVTSPTTIKRLKDKVLPVMEERQIPRYNKHGVNTDVAYEVWGIDIASVERKFKRLQKLNLEG